MEKLFRHSISQRNKSRGSNVWHGSFMDPATGVALTLNIYGQLLPSDLERDAEL
jgi:hypothetical protein